MAKGKSFFKNADIKLNREIKAERQKVAKVMKVDKGFIKQVKADQAGKPLSKAVKEAKAFKPFEGKQVTERTPEIKANFEVDPAKTEEQVPNKGFAQELRFNAWKNGVK